MLASITTDPEDTLAVITAEVDVGSVTSSEQRNNTILLMINTNG